MFHSAFPAPNSMPSLEHEYGSRACGIQGHDSSKSLHMYMSPWSMILQPTNVMMTHNLSKIM